MKPERFLHDLQQGLQDMLSDESWEEPVLRENPWFNPVLVRNSIRAILSWWEPGGGMPSPQAQIQPKRVGLILAGNIPLVGFHDFLSVLLSGHLPVVKPSHKDQALWLNLLDRMPLAFRKFYEWKEDLDPGEIAFLIATGSDNTARFLDHKFAGLPRLLRQNRYSAAVLDGGESKEELSLLAGDILLYHGMGCRSVSNILLPLGASTAPLIGALDEFSSAGMSPDWQRVVAWEQAVKAMGKTGFPSSSMVSMQKVDLLGVAPFGTLNICLYESEEQLADMLRDAGEGLQCVVGVGQTLKMGESQCPGWQDFADGIDVVSVLSERLDQANT